MEMDVVERFRSKSRRLHVYIFLGLSILLSAVTGLLLMHHIATESPLLLSGSYGTIMILATLLAFIFPAADSGTSLDQISTLVKSLDRKYLLFVITYIWLGVGFYLTVPLSYISSGFDMFPSNLTGLVAGTLSLCLGVQFILLNYIIIGSSKMSKEDLEQLKQMIDEDVDEFDPEEYVDRDIEDLEAYKERKEEEN